MIWSAWWIWAGAALALAILELVLPGFILLGFAIGAGVVALLFLAGGPLVPLLAGSLPLTLVIFAAVSVMAWFALRRAFGTGESGTRYFDKDIND